MIQIDEANSQNIVSTCKPSQPTMRLHILSDLHLEFSPYGDDLDPVQADVVVLAGDIHNGALGVQWASKRFPNTACDLCAG